MSRGGLPFGTGCITNLCSVFPGGTRPPVTLMIKQEKVTIKKKKIEQKINAGYEMSCAVVNGHNVSLHGFTDSRYHPRFAFNFNFR